MGFCWDEIEPIRRELIAEDDQNSRIKEKEEALLRQLNDLRFDHLCKANQQVEDFLEILVGAGKLRQKLFGGYRWPLFGDPPLINRSTVVARGSSTELFTLSLTGEWEFREGVDCEFSGYVTAQGKAHHKNLRDYFRPFINDASALAEEMIETEKEINVAVKTRRYLIESLIIFNIQPEHLR